MKDSNSISGLNVKPNSRTILLADDEPNAELVIRAFRSAGFENPIHPVYRAEDIMQYLKGEGLYADRAKFAFPHLLLLDMVVPEIDGWSVVSWLSQRRNFPFLPVVVLTTSVAPAEEQKARRLGLAAYEVKPATFQELVKVVDRIGTFWLLSPGLRKPET